MHLIFIYIGVFFGILFEGEMVMISSVIAAHHGYLSLWLVIPIGMAGIYLSDCFYFWLGRRKGKEWLIKNEKFKNKASINNRKLEKYPVLIFIIYRFTYGLRTITPVVIGTSNTKTRDFLFFSTLSIILWTTLYVSIGYLFGTLIKSELGHIEYIEKYFLGFLLLSVILFVSFFHFRKLSKEKRNKQLVSNQNIG